MQFYIIYFKELIYFLKKKEQFHVNACIVQLDLKSNLW